MSITVFIGGIMQGSRTDGEIDDQSYRDTIARVLRHHVPNITVIDPWVLHPDSVKYGPELARRTFIDLALLAGRVDALVAYVPKASMGTAVEMWNAHHSQVPVYTISPLTDNWVVMALSTCVFPDLASFADFVANGGLTQIDVDAESAA
jgi:hypothetical protein